MWLVFLILGLIIVLLIVLCAIGLKYRRDYWHFLGVPHDEPRDLSEIFSQLQHSEHSNKAKLDDYIYLQKLYKKFKGQAPFCGFYNKLEPRVLVLEQELMQQILIKNFSNFNDRGCYHNMKTDPLSADLYSLSGEQWKEMRLKLEPVFQRAYMKNFHESIREECERFMLKFSLRLQENTLTSTVNILLAQRQSANSKQYPAGHEERHHHATVLNVQPLMYEFVLINLAKQVYGLNSAQLLQKYPMEEFQKMCEMALYTHKHGTFMTNVMERYLTLFRSMQFSNTPKNVDNYFLNLMQDILQERQKSSSITDDYLQLLINIMTQELSTHETNDHTNAKELKSHLSEELSAHAFTFVRAGLEPTSKTLGYCLFELARDVVLQQRVRKEIEQAYEEHGSIFSYDCIQSLKFLGQVISETIRMHPITPYIIRRTLNDYRLPNNEKYIIRKDIYVVIPTHAIHNDPEIYPQPHSFNPDRFSPTRNKQRQQQCLWMGFGEGARNCLGVHFAQLQMRLLLSHLLHNYEFTLDDQHLNISMERGITLRAKPLNERYEYIDHVGRESDVVI